MNLSVVLCTYNRAAELEQSLTALSAQKWAPDVHWELVLVNNNSTDDTEKVCRRFVERASIPVTYVFEPVQGLSHARNSGVAAARGEIVAFTDDDVSPAADWISKLVSAMADPRLDGIGGRVLPLWPTAPPPWLDSHLRAWLALVERVEPTVLRPRGMDIVGANMAFRRTVFHEIGGFLTGLSANGLKLYRGGDIEFVRRAVAAGKTVLYDPDLVVVHRIPLHRMTKRYFRKWAFDSGEGFARIRPLVMDRNLAGVPLYQLRAIVSESWTWLASVLRRDPDVLCRQLAVITEIGAAWGYIKKRRAERRDRGSERA